MVLFSITFLSSQILIFWVTDNFLMRHKRLPRSVNLDKAEITLFERVKVRYRALHTKHSPRMHLEESDDSEVQLTDEELSESVNVSAIKRQQRNSLSTLT